MGTGFDLVGESADLGDSGSAWRFIRRFAAAWVRPIADGDGCAEEELDAAETRLGLALPAALREAYALFGRRRDLTDEQDHLLSPGELRLDDDGRVLLFRVENQAVAWWGVPLGEVGRPDPAVVLRSDAGPGHRSWQPFLGRFSLACVEMVLFESMMSAGVAGSDNRDLDEAAVGRLEEHFARLGLPDYPLWGEPDGPPVRWFGDDELLLREDGRQWLWVQARTVEALDRVRRLLPGEWLMVE